MEEAVEVTIRGLRDSLGVLCITGGTGSFGRAFTAHVLDNNLATRVIVLSRDELKQAEMKEQFGGDSRLRFFLGDVRDRDRLVRAFRGVDTVVHAAALKRVERSGEAVDEFVKTIVTGAMNVVEACHTSVVRRCVLLSTDKACASTTPYGACKSVAEHIFTAASVWGPTDFASVRYGNVVGSRGSVRDVWQAYYAEGLALPVTDEEMTRFWLPMDDAVGLVVLALKRMQGGEIFIPKGVERSTLVVKALEWFPLAAFCTTGKRAYEKKHEALINKEEADRCHDCGDVYVLLPYGEHWGELYGAKEPFVGDGFEYTSKGRMG